MKRSVVILTAMAMAVPACARISDTSDVSMELPVVVALGLDRDQAGLQKAAIEVNDPFGDKHGQYLSSEQIATKFGAKKSRIEKVVKYLDDAGTKARAHPTGGLVQAEMTVGKAGDIFGGSYRLVKDDDGTTHLHASGATVPGELDGIVTEVVGLNRTIKGVSSPLPTIETDVDTDFEEGCDAADTNETLEGLFDAVGNAALTAAGAQGEGMRASVLSIEAFSMRSYDAWTQCIGIANPTKPHVVDVIDDDFGLESEAREVDLDVSMVIAALPKLSHLDVVVFDQYGWIGNPIATALDPDAAGSGGLPDVISTSVVFCENDLADDTIELAEWTMASAAALGITVVSSAGDTGSSGCYPPDKKPGVQYPASSGFVLSVGGSQGTVGDAPLDPAVWDDPGQKQAGGGGRSQKIKRPSYQESIPGKPFRLLPDVAAPAAVQEAPQIPVCPGSGAACEWQQLGGTSMAAPLVASAIVQVKQLTTGAGKPGPGFVNPLIYGLSNDFRAKLMLDITKGTNDLFDVGCCNAEPGYDMVTGWGALEVSGLAAAAAASSAAPQFLPSPTPATESTPATPAPAAAAG